MNSSHTDYVYQLKIDELNSTIKSQERELQELRVFKQVTVATTGKNQGSSSIEFELTMAKQKISEQEHEITRLKNSLENEMTRHHQTTQGAGTQRNIHEAELRIRQDQRNLEQTMLQMHQLKASHDQLMETLSVIYRQKTIRDYHNVQQEVQQQNQNQTANAVVQAITPLLNTINTKLVEVQQMLLAQNQRLQNMVKGRELKETLKEIKDLVYASTPKERDYHFF